MYSFIKGLLISSKLNYAVIEAGGIGFKIFIPASVYSNLPRPGEKIQLHTSFIVREQMQALYGFLTEESRDLFEELMTVSGVGPKLALSLIGHLTIDEMKQAVGSADIAAISKVPGVGKKTAERLIVELKDKFYKKHPVDFGIPLGDHAQKIADAINALINLGYNQNKAQQAIKKTMADLPDSADLSQMITTALKFV